MKGRAHALEPVVQIGQSGLTDAVVAEIERALAAHELIKVKLAAGDREERSTLVEQMCARSDATAVQQVGKIVVLWKPREDDE